MQTPLPPLPPQLGYNRIPEWVPSFLAVMGLLVVSAILVYPLIRAWARRIEGRGADQAMQDELAQLRERVADLEGGQHQVAELAERLDFAERLLTARGDDVRLPLNRTPA